MPTTEYINISKQELYFKTISGKTYHFFGSDPNEIDIDDIAHGLAFTNRFTGHSVRPYSVAEHSILVTEIVDAWGGEVEDMVQGLMHDSPEYILGDMSAPLKGAMPSYRDLEELTLDRIADKFSFDPTLPNIVEDADWIALFVEAICLCPNSEYKAWPCWDRFGKGAEEWLDTRGRIPEDMLHPLEMKQMFLNLFHNLTEGRYE